MKSHFSFIPSETKLITRISPMRTYTTASYSIFTCSPPCQYRPQRQYNKIRCSNYYNFQASSTNTSMFLMSPETQKKTTFSSKSIFSPQQKKNGSKSKLLSYHKTLLLDLYKEEEEDKSDILKVSSNRYFKRKLVDFEYKQRRLSCCCTECGNQSKKIKKLLHVVPSNGSLSAKLSPQIQPQSFAMIKSMKSIKSSTTKFSNTDLISNQKTAKIMVNSLTPQKKILLKKREVNDKQLPAINKSSILIEFQRKRNNLNNLVETSILKSPKTMVRNSAPNLERFESPNSSPNLNIKINCQNLLESYKTDRFTTDFLKLRTENNLKINSFRQQGKNIMDCYLKKNSNRKLGPNSNILLKTFAR